MLKTKTNIDVASHYCNEYQRVAKDLVGNTLEPLKNLRLAALEKFSACGFPQAKQEDWKYISLTSLHQTPYSLSLVPTELNVATQAILDKSPVSYRLVFINGLFAEHLSVLPVFADKGEIIITHLTDMILHHPEQLFATWKPKLGLEKNSFIHLNTAFMHDGAYIYLPANTHLTAPIELLFISSNAQSRLIPLRNIIIAEENSHAVIIEKYIHAPESIHPYFTNTVTECSLAANSHIEHYHYLTEAKQAIHIGNLYVEQQQNSQFSAYSLALSGALIRRDISVKLLQAHAQCQLKGLYYAVEQQQIDQHTVVDHVSPYTDSEQFYQGISDDQARTVFNGKIIVRELAIKSKAQQLNKNLLLSPHAEITTKPQLEIFTDDIQCTHGASIGQLDENALFYLRARGLSATQASELLIKAFVKDILLQMPWFNGDVSLPKFLRNRLFNIDEIV